MSAEVKAIDKRAVHQICSGQVVFSLAVAVKELVENSLDAGSTSVEVKLKDHGLELVEVSDNGHGVAPANFAALTLKHHTSKLSEFDDLLTVSTFGFRGEALSSLCALSNLEVTTCHRSQSVASRIEYDINGCIRSQTSCAREVGTTVSLRNLFHSLPVRYKEFQRNIKKEFSRMIQMLQGYCLISSSIRISCYNQVGKGKKQLVLATTGTSSVRENIVSIFGQKQLQSCVEVRECGREEVGEGEGEMDPVTMDALQLFRLVGHVSRCTHGCGRSTTDRQFFYCNGRPIDHPRLSKAVNEVYHMYNRHQYPFILLDINTNREHVDVNITPDKRKVILQQEKALLLLVKASLHKIYHPMQAEYETSSVGRATSGDRSSGEVPALHKSLCALKRTVSCRETESEGESQCDEPRPKQPKLSRYGIQMPSNGHSHSMSPVWESEEQRTETHGDTVQSTTTPIPQTSGLSCLSQNSTIISCISVAIPSPQQPSPSVAELDDEIVESCTEPLANKTAGRHNGAVVNSSSYDIGCVYDATSAVSRSTRLDLSDWSVDNETTHSNLTTNSPSTDAHAKHEEHSTHVLDSAQTSMYCRREFTVLCDLSAITLRLQKKLKNGIGNGSEKTTENVGEGCVGREVGENGERVRFRARIRPDDNDSAEIELRRQISIPMFNLMEVVGQFNLGFIITKLADNLFIIDQHATDEKYNFERLQRDAVIENQKLIHPKHLELTAVSENVIMDNLKVFRMNGFHFHIDTTALPTKRLHLTSQPVYRGWTFGSDEIDEMVFLLSDSPGEIVRPTKVRQMFASRACRTSVMIGKSLNRAEMKKLVSNMAKQKLPWNCPHGRPTLRHLLDLSRL